MQWNIPIFSFPVMLFLNWSIVGLQYCVNFCFTARWFSYTHTHVCIYIVCVPVCVCVCTPVYIYTHVFYLTFFFPYSMWHKGLVPWLGIELAFPAVELWSLNHWTTREVLYIFFPIMIYHRILNIVPCVLQ